MIKKILPWVVIIILAAAIEIFIYVRLYSMPEVNVLPVENNQTVGASDLASRCVASGGQVAEAPCCQSASDFPNSCLIGACGCSPLNSRTTKICACEPGKCFNGQACVTP